MAAALHAQIWFWRSDQSSTPGQTTNGGPDLRYFLSETIQAQESGSLTYGAVLHLDIKICCIKEGRFINLQKSLHRSPGWPPKTIKKRLPAYQHLCIPASQMHISDSLHPCIFCTPGVLASSDPGALWPDSDLVKAFIMFYQFIKSNHCLPLSLMNSRNDWITPVK